MPGPTYSLENGIQDDSFSSFKAQSAEEIYNQTKEQNEKYDYLDDQKWDRVDIDNKVTQDKRDSRLNDELNYNNDDDGVRQDSELMLKTKQAWNFIAPQFMNVDGYVDGRKVNLDNKNIESMFNGDSLDKVAQDIKDAPEDPSAKAVFYYYKQYDGKDENGKDTFLFKPGVSATGAWDREKADMEAKGLELVFEKRMAGAEALENRVQALAMDSDAVDIGNKRKGGISYGSGYTELKTKDVLNLDNDKINYYENIEASKQAKLMYDEEGIGLSDSWIDAAQSGTASLGSKIGDVVLTVADSAINSLGGNVNLDDNIFDQWEKNADKNFGYDRRGSTAVMKESLYLWKHGDKFGAVFNDLGTKSEMVAESLPEMILMSIGAGSAGAALKASKYAKQLGTIGKELQSARLMEDGVAGAARVKQLKKIQQNTLLQIEKSGLDANKLIAMNELETASKLIRQVGQQHGFNAVVAGSTNKIIEERRENGDKDVTMGEVMAIGASQYILLGMDRMSFESIVGSRQVLDSFKSAYKFAGTSTKKKVASAIASGASAIVTEMGQEGAQEYLQTWGEIMGKDLGVDGKGLSDVYGDEKNKDEALTAGIMGAASGGIMSGTMTSGKMLKDTVTSGSDDSDAPIAPLLKDITSILDPDISHAHRKSAVYDHIDNRKDHEIDGLSDEAIPDMISSLGKQTSGDNVRVTWKAALDFLEQNKDDRSDAIIEKVLDHKDIPSELKDYRSTKAAMNLGTEIAAVVSESIQGSFTSNGKSSEFDDILSGEKVDTETSEPAPTNESIVETLETVRDKYIEISKELRKKGDNTSIIDSTIGTLNDYITSDGKSIDDKDTENVQSEIYNIGFVDKSKKKWWRPGLRLYKEVLSSLIETGDMTGSKNGVSLNSYTVFMNSRENKKLNKPDRNLAASIIGENRSMKLIAQMVVDKSKDGVPESFISAMNTLDNASLNAVDKYYNGNKNKNARQMKDQELESAIEYVNQAKSIEDLDNIRVNLSNHNIYVPQGMALKLFNAEVAKKLSLEPAQQKGSANDVELREIMAEIAMDPSTGDASTFNRFSSLVNKFNVPKEAINYMKHVFTTGHGENYSINELVDRLKSAENIDAEYKVIAGEARLTYDDFIELGKAYQSKSESNRELNNVKSIENAKTIDDLNAITGLSKILTAYAAHVSKAIASNGKIVNEKMMSNAIVAITGSEFPMKTVKLLIDSGKYRFTLKQLKQLKEKALGDKDVKIEKNEKKEVKPEVKKEDPNFSTAEIEQDIRNINWFKEQMNQISFEAKELTNGEKTVLKTMRDRLLKEADLVEGKIQIENSKIEQLKKMSTNIKTGDPILVKIKKIKEKIKLLVEKFKQKIKAIRDRVKKLKSTKKEFISMVESIDKYLESGKIGGQSKKKIDEISDKTKNLIVDDKSEIKKSARKLSRSELKILINKDLSKMNTENDSSSLRSSLKNKILALSNAKAMFALRIKTKEKNFFNSSKFMGKQKEIIEEMNDKVREVKSIYLSKELSESDKKIDDINEEILKYYDDNFDELDRATKAAERVSSDWKTASIKNLSVLLNNNSNELEQIKHAREMHIEIANLKKKLNNARNEKEVIIQKRDEKAYGDLLKIVKRKKFLDKLIKQAGEDANNYDEAVIAYSGKIAEAKEERYKSVSGAKELIDLSLAMVSLAPSDFDVMFLKKKFKRSKSDKNNSEFAGSKAIEEIENEGNKQWFRVVETPLSSTVGILDGSMEYGEVVENNSVDNTLSDTDIEAIFEVKNYNDSITLSEPVTNEIVNADGSTVKGKATTINEHGKVESNELLFKIIDVLSLNKDTNKYKVKSTLETAIKTGINAYLAKHREIKTDILSSSDEDIMSNYSVTEENLESFKMEVRAGNVPIATARKESLSIVKNILGIATSSDADIELTNTLNAGLSALVEAHLEDGGHIHPDKIDVGGKVFNTYRPTKAVDGELVLAMRAVGYLVMDAKRRRPASDPSDLTVDEKIMNSDTLLTEDKKNLIEKNQNTAWNFNENISDFHKEYTSSPEGKAKVLKVFGFRDIDYENEHVSDIELQQALNEKAEREAETMFIEYEELGHEDFYVKWGITKSLRATVKSDLNVQESKVHRIFASVKQFQTRLKNKVKKRSIMKAMASKLNEHEMIEVYLHQGFDMDPDKKSVLTVMREIRKIVDIYSDSEVVVQDGNQELSDFINAKEFDADLLLKAKQKHGNSMHSVQALMMLRHLNQHKKSGSKASFITTMNGEADAITSGPALLSLSVGTPSLIRLLEKAGIYTKEGKDKWEEYTKEILQKKYKDEYGEEISKDDIAFDAGSLIEAGNYHMKVAGGIGEIKTENNLFKDPFTDIYMTVGTDAINGISIKKELYESISMKKFIEIVTDKSGNINLGKVRFIFKDPTMIFNYGAMLGKILYSFARSTVGESYVDDLRQDDGNIPSTIVNLYYNANIEKVHKDETFEKDSTEAINKANSMLLSDTSMYKIFDKELGYSRRITEEELTSMIDDGESLNNMIVISDDMISAIKDDLDEGEINSGIKDSFKENFGDISTVRDGGKMLDVGVSAIFKFKFKQQLRSLTDKKGKEPITTEDVIKIIYDLEQQGFGHTIDGSGRIQPLYKEDSSSVSKRGYAKIGDAEASVNFKSISFTDNSGAAVTITIHANDAEIIADSLESSDFMSIYDAAIMGTEPDSIKKTAKDYGKSTIGVSMKNRFFKDYSKKLSKMIRSLSVDELMEVASEFNMFEESKKVSGLKKLSKDRASKFSYLGLLDYKNKNNFESEYSNRLAGKVVASAQKQRLAVMGGIQDGQDIYYRKETNGEVTSFEYYYGTDSEQTIFRKVKFIENDNGTFNAEVETNTNEYNNKSTMKAKYSGVKRISDSFEMDKNITTISKLNTFSKGNQDRILNQKMFESKNKSEMKYVGNKILDFLKVSMLDTNVQLNNAFEVTKNGVDNLNRIDEFYVNHMHISSLKPEKVSKKKKISQIPKNNEDAIKTFFKIIEENNRALLLEYIDRNFTSNEDTKNELKFRIKHGRPSHSSKVLKDNIRYNDSDGLTERDSKELGKMGEYGRVVRGHDDAINSIIDEDTESGILVNNKHIKMSKKAGDIVSSYLNDKTKGC